MVTACREFSQYQKQKGGGMRSSKEIGDSFAGLRGEMLRNTGEHVGRLAEEPEFPQVDFQDRDILVVFETLNDQESSHVSKVEPLGIWIECPHNGEYRVPMEDLGDCLLLTIIGKLEQMEVPPSVQLQ